MTQQGDSSWWDELYGESAPDTAPTVAGDTLDDHFAAATRATTGPPPPHPPDRTPEPAPATKPAPVPPRPDLAPGQALTPGPAPTPGQAAPTAQAPVTGQAPATGQAPPPGQAPVLASSVAAEAVDGRAPWESPAAGPRTFPSPPPPPPPVEAPTVHVPVPPPPGAAPRKPEQDPESGAEGDPGLTVDGSVPRPRTGHVGSRPPTYEPEPTALPVARPGELGELVPDTVLDGARYGTCTVRAASVRGDSARYRGEPRRDALLTARFGHDETALVLVAVAAGSRAAEDAHLAAADACRWIAEAVCRSHARLSDDIRSGRRGDLKSGLHRLTDRTYGKLRARAAERGLAPDEYTATLRCLLLPADPACRTRIFFGIGGGGLLRLRDGAWQDIEPLLPEPAAVTGAPVVGFGSPPPSPTPSRTPSPTPNPPPGRPPGPPAAAVPSETEEGDRLTMDLGITTAPAPLVEDPVPAPAEPFRFRASVARPGDTLLLASPGLAEPMRGEPALARELAGRWAGTEAPGLAAFLADTQVRVTGYADDRTAVGVWEA
ncbi:protein phosphatase 2C domain-containing protein [Streptomyces sp. NPDC058700]|uniref:protein phosphatase 2C domain-containing protein n=1 Tax=Streptomyces sp. NPDC058700 TaxID=3346607 RepID=UPI0036551DFC